MSTSADQVDLEALDHQLAVAGLAPLRDRQALVFNPNNAATELVEHLRLADGTEAVRKVLVRDRPPPVPHWSAGQSPGHWNYWRREVDAYLSCAPDSRGIQPGQGVRAPALLGHVTPSDGTEVLVLEHVEGLSGAELGDVEVVAVARGLGVWQAELVAPASSDLPMSALPAQQPWWSRDWIFEYALTRPPGPEGYADDRSWEHPLVLEGFGDALERIRRGFAELYSELEQWRAVAAALPRVPSHMDCWANNIVVPRSGDPVLIDWSFCGVGHIGADAGNLVPDGLLDHYGAPDGYARTDRLVTEAYLGGLRTGGWDGPEEMVRLGICLAPVKFAWLPALMAANASWSGPTGYGGQEGLEPAEVFRRRARVFDAMLDQVAEARRLAARLDLV